MPPSPVYQAVCSVRRSFPFGAGRDKITGATSFRPRACRRTIRSVQCERSDNAVRLTIELRLDSDPISGLFEVGQGAIEFSGLFELVSLLDSARQATPRAEHRRLGEAVEV
jgi:hypothetical protein